MPYVVTTTTFKHSGRRAVQGGAEIVLSDSTRRAVATLDEAQEAAGSAVREHVTYDDEDRATDRFVSEAMTLPESGGTIGPLPDGTMIEVEPCDRFWLLGGLGRDAHSGDTTDEIIDAYNAAQAVPA